MEFIQFDQAMEALGDLGITSLPLAEDQLRLEMGATPDAIVRFHLATGESQASPPADARVTIVPAEQLVGMIEHIFHRLHLSQFLLIPIGPWRGVFDGVAFSLAANADWQEIEAIATVKLNTRDPLLCGPADLHTVMALISAVFADADLPHQGFTIATTASPVLIEVNPDGAALISVGDEVLADEILETVEA